LTKTMSESVKDLLENFGVEDEAEKVISLIHDATDAGMSRKAATPPAVISVIHENTDNTMFEICDTVGVDVKKLMKQRRELIKSGVLDISIDRPSKMCQGKPSELLETVENAHSDMIFDGSKPTSWLSAVSYIHEYIHMSDMPIEVVAEQYRSSVGTIVKKSEKLVNLDEFDRVYADPDIDGSLGALLARRRHSVGTLRYSLSDTSDTVRDRLTALDRESNYELKSENYGEKTFYWAKDPASDTR